jgi:hypothetical protein
MPNGKWVIPAFGMLSIPVAFRRVLPNGYFRDDWTWSFIDETGLRSNVSFALEAWPVEQDFKSEPLGVEPLGAGGVRHPPQTSYQLGAMEGPWRGMNCLQVQSLSAAYPKVRFRVWTNSVINDPLEPQIAAAGLRGLPKKGFLRIELSRPMSRDFSLRVDLVDKQGQRFAVWENFGVSYFRPASDVWLNLNDFGAYFWGRCTDNPQFHPENVEEIQIRFYLSKPNDPVDIALSFMRAG